MPQVKFQDFSVKRIREEKDFEKKGNFLYNKSSIINKVLVGRAVKVYDGFSLVLVVVKRDMIGRKFGEYIFTKQLGSFIHHSNKIEKKKT